jgi:hypothetical protein
MKKSLIPIVPLLMMFCAMLVSGQDDKVVNGGFQDGFKGWQTPTCQRRSHRLRGHWRYGIDAKCRRGPVRF